jgi:nuclease-like protein
MLALGGSLVAHAGERCIAIDGDTLVCNHQKVRLTNVYAAELNQAGGAAAKRNMQAMIARGEVTLRPLGQDRYGRTLAEVYVNGRRIEQTDIGPRAGRGAGWRGDRHHQRHFLRKALFRREPSEEKRQIMPH